MIEKIQRIKAEIEALKVSKSEDLENIRIKYLSKKGEISQLFNDFRTVAAEQKREVGKELNELKSLKKGENVSEDLLEVIRLITVTMDGMKDE